MAMFVPVSTILEPPKTSKTIDPPEDKAWQTGGGRMMCRLETPGLGKMEGGRETAERQPPVLERPRAARLGGLEQATGPGGGRRSALRAD